MAPELKKPHLENDNLRSFCLCDGSEQCDRRAVSDMTADSSEPQQNLPPAVPHVAYGKRRRRQASDLGEERAISTGQTCNPITYTTALLSVMGN